MDPTEEGQLDPTEEGQPEVVPKGRTTGGRVPEKPAMNADAPIISSVTAEYAVLVLQGRHPRVVEKTSKARVQAIHYSACKWIPSDCLG